MWLFPTKKQYKQWSLPSKLGVIGSYITILMVPVGLYWWLYPRPTKSMDIDQVELLANVILSKVLVTSPLCCDVKTSKLLIYLPFDGEIVVPVSTFIGYIPDSMNMTKYSFAFSTNPMDTLRLLDCKMVGSQDLNIFFFENGKALCSKSASLDLRDPLDYCLKKPHKRL